MTIYYSASKNAFLDSALFGSLTVDVPDPHYDGDGEPPLISILNDDHNLPSDAVEISDEQHQALLSGQGIQIIQPDANGYPVLTDPPPLSLDELSQRKRQELDAARDNAFTGGLPYTINGADDVIQTRPQDQINLLGLNAKAQRLIAADQQDALLKFRALSNTTYELTAIEMDELTMTALSYIESIYDKSWQLKDALDDAKTREAIESINW